MSCIKIPKPAKSHSQPDDIIDQKSRIDKILSSKFSISREMAKRLISHNLITINDKQITEHDHKINETEADQLEKSEKITQFIKTFKPATTTELKAENIHIDIRYEDEHLAVINKPANLVVHPGVKNQDGTLANALKFHFNKNLSTIGEDSIQSIKGKQNSEQGINNEESNTIRPGIVHRLDKNTTGLMIVAKNNDTHHMLSELIQARSLTRKYLALCYGAPRLNIGTIDTLLIKHPTIIGKMKITQNEDKGKQAITHYLTKETFHDNSFSLIEFTLETGRTHQIRVHAEKMGNSVLGDTVYGKKHQSFFFRKTESESLSLVMKQISSLEQQMLHSHCIKFTHPITQELIELQESPPEIFQNIITDLRKN